MPRGNSRPLSLRFWGKVQRCEHEPWCVFCCWPWMGSRKEAGYGQLSITIDGKPRPVRANRLAWEIFHGRPLPTGLWALHSCDFPPCCNPAHLYPGTPAQNAKDAMDRGRLLGRYHGEPTKGDKHPQSKLKDGDVIMIRTLYAQGDSLIKLAEQFGVKSPALHSVVHGKTWRHLPLFTEEIAARPKENHMQGEKHHQAKLTEEQVRLIRSLHQQGERISTLAKQFSVTWDHMYLIVNRKAWTHIP